MPDLTGHLTARAGDGHAPPLSASGKAFNLTVILLSPPVRFPALTPFKPQAPPLVCSPANSCKFQPCGRTPQAAGLTASLRHRAGSLARPTPSPHRLQPGLPGYLIRFAPPAFGPHRRARSSRAPSPLVVLPGLLDFAPTPGVPSASPAP